MAGVFAKQFMGSVARKALELSKQASATAKEAKKVAETADTTARSADNRAISLYQALQLRGADVYRIDLIYSKKISI